MGTYFIIPVNILLFSNHQFSKPPLSYTSVEKETEVPFKILFKNGFKISAGQSNETTGKNKSNTWHQFRHLLYIWFYDTLCEDEISYMKKKTLRTLVLGNKCNDWNKIHKMINVTLFISVQSYHEHKGSWEQSI